MLGKETENAKGWLCPKEMRDTVYELVQVEAESGHGRLQKRGICCGV